MTAREALTLFRRYDPVDGLRDPLKSRLGLQKQVDVHGPARQLYLEDSSGTPLTLGQFLTDCKIFSEDRMQHLSFALERPKSSKFENDFMTILRQFWDGVASTTETKERPDIAQYELPGVKSTSETLARIEFQQARHDTQKKFGTLFERNSIPVRRRTTTHTPNSSSESPASSRDRRQSTLRPASALPPQLTQPLSLRPYAKAGSKKQ